MATGARYRVPLRRRREGRTDYRLRLALLKSGKPRLVIRKTLRNLHAQLVEFHPKGDKVLAEATAQELAKFGWKGSTGNAKAAYMTGYLLGKKAGKKEAVVDFGLQNPRSMRLKAAAQGAKDAGLSLALKDGLPNQEEIESKEVQDVVSSMEA